MSGKINAYGSERVFYSFISSMDTYAAYVSNVLKVNNPCWVRGKKVLRTRIEYGMNSYALTSILRKNLI